MEKGHGITRDHTTPADILIAGRDRGKPATLDITITSPLLCHLRLGKPMQMRTTSSTPMDPNARSWVGPACHWLWGSMAIEAKRPQHHLQASVPPAPSPVLHQASSCGLHYGQLKSHIGSNYVPANNTGGKRD